MQTIKKIVVEAGEECNVDVDILHDTLSKLPAEMYLRLYRKMHEKIIGYPYWMACNTSINAEDKAEE